MPKYTFKDFGVEGYAKDDKVLTGLGSNLDGIDPQAVINAGMTDSRPHSNAMIFDLFVMGKHGVPFKDILKFEKGELKEHDKAKYLQEFKKFVEEHPISTKDEFGNQTFYPENAKAWGELFNQANQVLKDYKIPNINLADPKAVEANKEEMAVLSKIGTDFVQVEQAMMEKFKVPEVTAGFMEGFGTVANLNSFHSNIYALQSLKSFTLSVPGSEEHLGTSLNEMAVKKYTLEKHKDLYAGKSLEEFNKAFPTHYCASVIPQNPLVYNNFNNRPPEEQQALFDYVVNDKPLPEKLINEMGEDPLKVAEEMIFGESSNTEAKSELEDALDSGRFVKATSALVTNGAVPKVKDLSPEQRKAAVDGFNSTYAINYSMYSGLTMPGVKGKNVFDLIKIGDKPLREYCEEKYAEDKLYGAETEFKSLPVEQQEEYMKLNAMCATVDPKMSVKCYDIHYSFKKGEVVEDNKPILTSEQVQAKIKEEAAKASEYVRRNRARVNEVRELSDRLVQDISAVDFNLLGQGSNQFDEMLKSVKNLKKFTDTKFMLDKNDRLDLALEEELLDKQYDALQKIQAYLDYKTDQFNKEPGRRNSPKREAHEQPRVKAAVDSFSTLQDEYIKNQKKTMSLENDVRRYLGKQLDTQEEIWKKDKDEYLHCMTKSVDLIYNLDGKKWEGKEEGKALEHYKKITKGLHKEYTEDLVRSIYTDQNHPGREIIVDARNKELEDKYTTNKELIKMAKEKSGIKLDVKWPKVKTRIEHNTETIKYRTDLLSKKNKDAINHKDWYNDEDKALAANKSAGKEVGKMPKGPMIKS